MNVNTQNQTDDKPSKPKRKLRRSFLKKLREKENEIRKQEDLPEISLATGREIKEAPKKIPLKLTTYKMLRQNGAQQNDAIKMVGISKGYASMAEKEIKESINRELAALVPAAIRSLELLAKGELVGQMKDIKGVDVRGAAETILERVAPKVKENQVVTQNSYTQIIVGSGDIPTFFKKKDHAIDIPPLDKVD